MHASAPRPHRARRWRRIAAIALGVALALAVSGAALTAALVKRAEERYPPRGRFVDARGARLHVLERGTGTPIVLIHGAFGAADDWDPTILDALAASHRVLAFDRPGHGHSDALAACDGDPREQARVLVDAWRALGVERPTVVGFSYGGTVALAAALDAPRDVGALVTINGAIHSWGGTFHPSYELIELPLVGPLFTHTWGTPLALLASSGSIEVAFAPRGVPETFARSPIALEVRPRSLEANARDIDAADAFLRDQEGRYRELALPLVIVVSESDRIVTPSIHSHALAREVAGAELIRVPDAGHQLLYTHPDTLIDAIERAAGRVQH